ncbi:hypothetical protein JX265_001392 [Neoarthrinium moseri]|uniref:Fe2OG dioxygenase domain-containing protein n=1 Tax=Neoarthrinium moseri TaxID=1658444 RepID=A0A9Q0ARU7_9PEZI|nr:hypothetical protein JX265_001392 [Neoarthrinium moseri]
MSQSFMTAGASRIATIDLSPFSASKRNTSTDSQRLKVGQDLVEALHRLGFVKVTGHGMSKDEINKALDWTKRLFDLPECEKMKAPHPPGPMPHRGYSSIGKEKVYSQDDVDSQTASGNVEKTLRKISDFKESYEIGSEHDPVQQNIWLPETILPHFKEYMNSLYERLAKISHVVLDAMSLGLGLEGEARGALNKLMSGRHCQLRLLHYPAISKEKIQKELLARLPAHCDWGTLTMLFQDSQGGLELQDPHSKQFIHAEPEDSSFVLNVSDMLQRFTNGYFVSALHRVSVPDPETVPESGLPARYSVPFFVAPDFSHIVETLPQFITTANPAKYEPVRFDQYGSIVSKYQYQNNNS